MVMYQKMYGYIMPIHYNNRTLPGNILGQLYINVQNVTITYCTNMNMVILVVIDQYKINNE